MAFAPEAVQSDHDLERKSAESAPAKEAAGPEASPVLGGFLSALSADGSNGCNHRLLSNPVMRHGSGGEMRVLAMRRAQQGLGNHKTHRLVGQLQRSSLVQRQCSCGGTCESCQSKNSEALDETEETGLVQRQAAGASGAEATVPYDVIPADSPGQPLDHGARGFMESRLGADFSEVRVHTDSRAAESADALAANAYTTGRDIYFAAGKYAPESREGQHLLAHELTHTVQQAESNLVLREPGVLRLSQPDEPMEQEAEAIAGQISRKNASVFSHYPLAVARQTDAGVSAGSGLEERAVRPTSKEVIRALEKPDPIAGVGDYREAFRVLNGLAMFDLLATLDELKTLGEFDLLQANFGSGEGSDKARLRVAMHAVRDRGSVTADGFAAAEGDALATLPADQQADVRAYLARQPSGIAPVPTQQGTTASGAQATTPVACTTPYKTATNFQELIDLVRATEARLAVSGITSARDQIHALRGIYYGTVWSKDFSEEKSTTRNEGFQRFTRPSEDPAKTVPPDVQKSLDCGLFNALQNSQDLVDPSGRHVDFGHLIIALDARFDPKLSANVSYPVMGINIDMGGTGPELVTWVGDLGGGTARLARARVKAPGTNASISFTGSDYGGSINLEGDIAGYVVASGGSAALSAPNVPAGKRLSNALQDYLSPGTPGSAWKDRAKTFLAMNGGVFDPSGALTNRTTLIAAFSAKFQVFACNYLASRVKDNHLTSSTAKAAASHVIPASEEIAETFINALEDSLKTGIKIEAKRFPAAKSAKPGACTQQIWAASGASLFSPGASVDEEEKEPTPVQRQATPGAGTGAVYAYFIPADSSGQPLDHGTRGFMESRLGADFSEVRVHTDSRAAESADALAANAYTTGRDIYFAAGKYAPASREGQHLLAHELTHTVQQKSITSFAQVSRRPNEDIVVGRVDDPMEREADGIADVVVGSQSIFGAGEFAPETTDGKRLLAHDLMHVVQQAGGGASKGAVQRVVPVGATVQRKSAVQDAIDSGDTARIDALHHSALQLATPDQKISLIRIILENGGATYRLELLWNGVKDPVVEANIDLWRTTWEKYAGLMAEHPRKTQFTRDVADLANAMLTESEALCEAYLRHYGLSSDAKKPGQNTPERDQSISAVQQKAVEVMGAQTQLKRLWAVTIQTDAKYLGYGSSMKGSYPFELDSQPVYASPEGLELWKRTNASVKELTSSIDNYLEAFPELYPLVMGGKSSKRDAYSDPTRTNLAATKPLDAIEQGLRQTIDNIKASKGPMVETLARERKLGLVEQQLLSGARTVPGNQSRNWKSSPIWSAMVPAITAKGGFVTPEGVLMLGLQIAVAVTTGGIGNLLLSGAQAVLSHAEAGVLQTASDTSLSAKNAIVSKQEVAMAKIAAAVDAAFLVFDLVPGVKQARGTWGAARGSAQVVEKAAAELEKKALQYEAKLMQKAEKLELEALQKAMQQQADAAGKALQDAKTATADASGAERTLTEAEVRKAEEALVKAQTSLRATKALSAGEALVVEMGGRRFSWVQGRGLVICASPCAAAVDWMDLYGLDLVKDARAHSQLAGDAVEKRIMSARQHLADLDQMLKMNPPDPAAFARTSVHANSIIEEVKAQQRFAMLRYPLESGATAVALGNKEWAEAVMQELRLRKQAIEDVDKAFYGSLANPNVKSAALAAHASEWESKLGKVRDPAKPSEKLGSLTQALEEHGGKSGAVDPNQRAILMQNIDTALTNYERELRGQREIVLSGGDLKAFTDEAAGRLLYPGLTTKELRDAKKPDYIAELGNKLIIGDSKGAGDVTKSIAQIKPALDTAYVKNAVAAGKMVECRVYLDAADAAARGYQGLGHPPVLHQLIDGKYQALEVTDKLPLYVVYN